MLGNFIAKVKEIGISESKAGLPQVAAVFICHYKEGDQEKTFEKTWFGSLKDAAAPITLQTLVILGYKFEVKDLSDIAAGKGVDFSKEVEVSIKENNYGDKITEQISGIFEVGQAGFKKLKPEDAVTKLKGVNISGAVMSFMETKGIKPSSQGLPY